MTISSHDQFRNELATALTTLLVGPLAPDEILDTRPSDTYLTGILWPRDAPLSVLEDDDDAVAYQSGTDGAFEFPIPGYRLIKPCSIGITFSIKPGTSCTIELAETARYHQVEPRQESSSDNTPNQPQMRLQWSRRQLNYHFAVAADETRAEWRQNDFQLPDGSVKRDSNLTVHIKRRINDDHIVITATLINESRSDDELQVKESMCLFQAGLRVQSARPDGMPGIVPRPPVRYSGGDEDAISNCLLYQHVKEYATGHGVSTDWPTAIEHSVQWIKTSWVPKATVEGTSPAGHPTLLELQDLPLNPLSAASLSDSKNRQQICNALLEFCNLYGRWINTTLKPDLGLIPSDLHPAASANLDRCETAFKRMRRGVDMLLSHENAWLAFSLANEAMDKQARYNSKRDRKGPLRWRPFQLAFMLLVLPGIVDPADDDRLTMDLLWFPTGGGKTEAYLGLTAFSIFFQRLESSHRRSHGGVDVLMRYTLRLLTVQQFQRAAALIHACDTIRENDRELLGDARITLGLYVGSDSTPNRLEEAGSKIAEEKTGSRPSSTPIQLLQCPVCGEKLGPASYHVDIDAGRMTITCFDSNCSSAGSSLPVQTVDEVIYRDPPSLLIGTVDKFAQIPRNASMRKLFGLGTPNRPNLIIQDELHLISGPLGSMTGLYEAAIDLLCSSNGVRPKVIGSSATIGRAAQQVRALFDRDVLQFPPPGFSADDSFFAIKDTTSPTRLYLGVASAGRSPKFALQAVLGNVMGLVKAQIEKNPGCERFADPYWTCVAYFNSLRELGGAIVMMHDDVQRTMRVVGRRLSATPRRITDPQELSSRISSSAIPRALAELEVGLTSGIYEQPKDIVLASNMISVGVDVPRLGLMTVNGQPKSTAEYIQATSRVGRSTAGLVIALYNFGRPRDVSHYEHFRAYHEALYRGVEATSVTPWASRARDKALHAVFAALVRHLIPGMHEESDAVDFNSSLPEVRRLADYLIERASNATAGLEEAATRADLQAIIDEWSRRADTARATQDDLQYWEHRVPFGSAKAHIMRDAESMKASDQRSWPTPNSMREIEPSTAFVLRRTAAERKARSGENNG